MSKTSLGFRVTSFAILSSIHIGPFLGGSPDPGAKNSSHGKYNLSVDFSTRVDYITGIGCSQYPAFPARGIIHKLSRFEEKGTQKWKSNRQRNRTCRQVRTKRRIREALATLLEETSIEKITVKALADQADIDRKTFYLHYGSIGDLLAEIQGSSWRKPSSSWLPMTPFSPDFDALGFSGRSTASLMKTPALSSDGHCRPVQVFFTMNSRTL